MLKINPSVTSGELLKGVNSLSSDIKTVRMKHLARRGFHSIQRNGEVYTISKVKSSVGKATC